MMRNLEPTPLIRSETEESVSSVGSDKTLSVASSDRPEIVRMIRKVDVKDETVSKGTVNRCQSVTSLASLRNPPCGSNRITNGGDGLSRRPSKFSIDGHNGFCSTRSSPELFEDASEFFNEIRRLRIENQELRAADHRLKAEICDLKAKILALYGQLSKCRQLARAFNNCVS